MRSSKLGAVNRTRLVTGPSFCTTANERVYITRTSFDVDEHGAKTERSEDRIVDLCSDANDFLKFYAGDRHDGFLFAENDKPLERNRLYRAASKLRGPYHGLRRARITHHYSRMETPAEEQIIKSWVGHESHESTQTERYSKLWQDAAWRREFAERAGIGFRLPVSVRLAREEAVVQATP